MDFATATETIAEVIPRIIKIFKILLPTMFPIVISALPFKAAVMLTAASGALVPIATIVRPITSWGTPSLSAIPEEPSTNQSAPFTNIKNPSASSNNWITISISFPPRFPSNFLVSAEFSLFYFIGRNFLWIKKASPSAEIKPEALLCSVSTLSSNKSLAASLRTGASFQFSG